MAWLICQVNGAGKIFHETCFRCTSCGTRMCVCVCVCECVRAVCSSVSVCERRERVRERERKAVERARENEPTNVCVAGLDSTTLTEHEGTIYCAPCHGTIACMRA